MKYEKWLIELQRQDEEIKLRNEIIRVENEVDENLLENIKNLITDISEATEQANLSIIHSNNLINICSKEGLSPLLIILAKYRLINGKREVIFRLEKHRTKELTDKYYGHLVSNTWLKGFISNCHQRSKERKDEFKNTYKIKPNLVPKPNQSILFMCKLCEGDGGATGNCQRCGGNGIEPNSI